MLSPHLPDSRPMPLLNIINASSWFGSLFVKINMYDSKPAISEAVIGVLKSARNVFTLSSRFSKNVAFVIGHLFCLTVI